MSSPSVLLEPVQRPLTGAVALPGSKSITNRALLLAGLGRGTTRLTGALSSDDTGYMSEALRAMGIGIEQPNSREFIVEGRGKLLPPGEPLFLGNAGTATRFLTAAVATQQGVFCVDGDEHMRKRPIRPLLEALERLGVEARSETGCPPVEIRATGGFGEDEAVIDAGLSSQYVSALMMAAPFHPRRFVLRLDGSEIGARGYIGITEAVMRAFGAQVRECEEEAAWEIQPSRYLACGDYVVEPDASAATYWWAAEVLTSGKIELGVNPGQMMQPDARAWDWIRKWPRLPAEINGAQMQDAVPTLAVLAAFNETPVRFVGIENLRVKECDRIAACCAELNKLKAGLAAEDEDDLLVQSDPELIGQEANAEIHTYADHRIAMAFSLAGLVMKGVRILDASCVGKTYPKYWDDLRSLGVMVT
ncbi:MAG: 3-phosphoshikimate 1-carboxyvinyltransferase [Verrucomicrobiota bacterium]